MKTVDKKSNILNIRLLAMTLFMLAVLFLASCSSNDNTQDNTVNRNLPEDEEMLHNLMTSVNLPGSNIVITDGSFIYFNNNDNLFSKSDADGDNLVILNDQYASWPLIADHQFFYAAGNGSGYLSKMKLDGSSHVRAGSGILSNLIYHDDMIYAIEEPARTLIRIKTDGTKREEIIPFAVSSFILRGNSLYVAGKSAQDGIVRYDLTTNNSISISQSAAGNLQTDGDLLYYSDLQKEYELYSVDLSDINDLVTNEVDETEIDQGTNETDSEQKSLELEPILVMEHSLDRQFAIIDRTIFFIDSSSQQQLFQIKLDQNNKANRNDAVLTVDDAVDNFCLIGPYVYYRRAGINRLYRTESGDSRPIRIN